MANLVDFRTTSLAPVHCCKPIKNGSQFCSGVIVDRHFHQGPLEMGKLRESRQQITRLVGRMRKYQAVRKNNEPAARSAGKKDPFPSMIFRIGREFTFG